MRTRSRSSITFEGGLSAPFHRWFRLTPSFSPELVEAWLTHRQPALRTGATVLDPFSGAGTTCVAAAALGFDSVGFEINPLLAFVSATSSSWDLDADVLGRITDGVVESTRDLLKSLPLDAEAAATRLGEVLPPIHNIHRWWRDDVLRQLIILRHQIDTMGGEARDHLTLALADIVYATANITLGRLQLHFVDRTDDVIDVLGAFVHTISKTREDLAENAPEQPGTVTIYNADSRDLGAIEDESINAVFTSPPYPNRYSYVWNTRPHLYLLQLITTAKEAGDLDVETIAGTWGRATSSLQKGYVEPSLAVKEAAGDVLAAVHERSVLMGNYVTKYFNDLDVHLRSLHPKLAPGAPIGYVVGNTETQGVMVEVHDILASIMESAGYTSIDQDVLRARNSGVGLTEVTVSAQKPS